MVPGHFYDHDPFRYFSLANTIFFSNEKLLLDLGGQKTTVTKCKVFRKGKSASMMPHL